MDYKLAKQLKDAGFSEPPQYAKDGGINLMFPNFYSWFEDQDGTRVYCPDLSVLVKECDKDFYNLEHVFDGGIDGKEELWWAYGKNHSMGGFTPDEAVARLWLAIHGK